MELSSPRFKSVAVTAGLSFWFFIIISVSGMFSFEIILIFIGSVFAITQIFSSKIYKELDIFAIDSNYSLNNLEISNASLSGTGEIYLGENLRLEKLILNGVYEVTVSKNLPIVVSGNAQTPTAWINATIGTLNQVNESYRLLVEIIDGSEVIFNDE